MKIFANWSRIHEVKPTEKLEELKKGRKRRREGMCMAPVFEQDGEDQGVPRQVLSVAKISEGRLKQILCLKKNQGKRNLNCKLPGEGEGEGRRVREDLSLVKISRRTVILVIYCDSLSQGVRRRKRQRTDLKKIDGRETQVHQMKNKKSTKKTDEDKKERRTWITRYV